MVSIPKFLPNLHSFRIQNNKIVRSLIQMTLSRSIRKLEKWTLVKLKSHRNRYVIHFILVSNLLIHYFFHLVKLHL